MLNFQIFIVFKIHINILEICFYRYQYFQSGRLEGIIVIYFGDFGAVFVYPADQDSVLHVTKDDYTNCKTDSPLDKFTDGHTVYEFKQSGPHYFISGVADHCHKNEKLLVVVMADRSNHSSNGTAVSPPSPAPAGEESPSPPSPSPSEESSPPSPGSEAPSEVSDHPKNGAHSMAVNVVGIVVILVGSLLAFAI